MLLGAIVIVPTCVMPSWLLRKELLMRETDRGLPKVEKKEWVPKNGLIDRENTASDLDAMNERT